jgi:transglutaminase-like putative cysteine protease
MRRLAREGSMDPAVRQATERIVRQVFDHDFLSEYLAIFNWVRRHVRYVRDPILIEQVASPRATLQMRAGDCDDMAVLIAAMIGSVGGRTRFVAGAYKYRNGRPVLEHVWVEAHEPRGNNWVVLDPVPGRQVPQMLGKLVSTIKSPAVE